MSARSARLQRSLVMLEGLACLLAGEVSAQAATGKLEGRVQDEVGAPLAEAQVYLVGSAFSAVADTRGYYFINNVPAGTYQVRAIFIGFQPVQATGLRILADQTVTQDFTLASAPLQLQEITVVAAENLLVPRDEVTTKQRLDGGFTRELPIDRVDNLLALQPGVVAALSADGKTTILSIRGGRSDEAVTYVDGVPVSPGFRAFGTAFATASTSISVGTNGLEEASVVTGASSAEFGNTQSGVVSLITRTGGTALSGALGYETDEPFGVNHSLGFNRIEASLGGPLVRNLTFFGSGVLEGRKSAPVGFGAEDAPVFVMAGLDTTVRQPSELDDPSTKTVIEGTTADTTLIDVPRFAVSRGRCEAFAASANAGIRSNYGLDCEGSRTPGSASSIYELQGKLSYTYGSGSRLALGYLASRTQGRDFDYSNLYNPRALSGFGRWSRILTLSWTGNLRRTAERAIALETYLSYQQDRTLLSPLTEESEFASRDPFGGFLLRPLHFLFDFDNFPIDQTLIDHFTANTPGTRRTPFDSDHSDRYRTVDQFRNNAYGLTGFSESGGPDDRLRMYREFRYLGRANLDWQLDRQNRLKAGGEIIRYSITKYVSFLAANFGDVSIERPLRWAAFLQDRLDLGDLVLVGGLRYDWYSTRADRPFLLDTTASSSSFGEYIQGYDPRYSGTFQGQDLLIRRRDRSHGYLSPHIQVSFPVTARTDFRLSYAHQVQAPDFAVMLLFVNFGGMGTDLDFGKTIAFEFGIRHAFSDDMVLDLAAYNKDNIANAAARTFAEFDPVNQRMILDERFTTADFGNTRGLDVRLDRRIGSYFNGTIGYSYQVAKSTGSDPFSNEGAGIRAVEEAAGGIGPPPQGIFATTLSRPHSLTGALSLAIPPGWHRKSVLGALLGNVGLFSTFRLTSGTAYTRCTDSPANASVLSGEGCPGGSGDLNNARLPTFKQLDLRVTKGFTLARLGLTAYLDARNLLNSRNLVRVFAATGNAVSSGDLEKSWASDSSLFALEAAANGLRIDDGVMDLRFGGAAASGCGAWVSAGGLPAVPNCVYLVRAEERFGDGDHLFTVAEQRRASSAFYAVDRGLYTFTGSPRRLRVGLEVTF